MANGRGHSGHRYRLLRDTILGRRPLICHICRQFIDHTLRFPDRGSPELHCIIPVSLGGALNESNCAPAHRYCNQKQGNRVEQQPWLAGLEP